MSAFPLTTCNISDVDNILLDEESSDFESEEDTLHQDGAKEEEVQQNPLNRHLYFEAREGNVMTIGEMKLANVARDINMEIFNLDHPPANIGLPHAYQGDDTAQHDTIAVSLKDGKLYVAGNVKKRGNDGKAVSFGIQPDHHDTIKQVVQRHLGDDFPHNSLGIVVVKPKVPPKDSIENAKIHAEMQLRVHLKNMANCYVSKAPCVKCETSLALKVVSCNFDPNGNRKPKHADHASHGITESTSIQKKKFFSFGHNLNEGGWKNMEHNGAAYIQALKTFAECSGLKESTDLKVAKTSLKEAKAECKQHEASLEAARDKEKVAKKAWEDAKQVLNNETQSKEKSSELGKEVRDKEKAGKDASKALKEAETQHKTLESKVEKANEGVKTCKDNRKGALKQAVKNHVHSVPSKMKKQAKPRANLGDFIESIVENHDRESGTLVHGPSSSSDSYVNRVSTGAFTEATVGRVRAESSVASAEARGPTAGANAHAGIGGVSAQARLELGKAEAHVAGIGISIGPNLNTGVDIGLGGVGANFAGFGVHVGPKMAINTPLGGAQCCVM